MNNIFVTRLVLWIADQAPSNNIFPSHDEPESIQIVSANRFSRVLDVMRTRTVDAILVSLPFTDCAAEELLNAIRDLRADVPVILYEPRAMRRSDAEIQRLGVSRYIADAVPAYYLG